MKKRRTLFDAKTLYFNNLCCYEKFNEREKVFFEGFNVPQGTLALWNREYLELQSKEIEKWYSNCNNYELGESKSIALISFSGFVFRYIEACHHIIESVDLERIINWLAKFKELNIWKRMFVEDNNEREKTGFQCVLVDDNYFDTYRFNYDKIYHYDDFNGLIAFCHYTGRINEMERLIDVCLSIIENSSAIVLARALYAFIEKYYPKMVAKVFEHYPWPKELLYEKSGFINYSNYKSIIEDFDFITEISKKVGKNRIEYELTSKNDYVAFGNKSIDKFYKNYQKELVSFCLFSLNNYYVLLSLINDNKLRSLMILDHIMGIYGDTYFIDYKSSNFSDLNAKIESIYRKIAKLLICKNFDDNDNFDGLIPKLYNQDYYLYSVLLRKITLLDLCNKNLNLGVFWEDLCSFSEKTNDFLLERIIEIYNCKR